MDIVVVHNVVDEKTLRALAEAWHKTLIKGVADVSRGVIALGGDWHMDANAVLLADGSEQKDVWGFNLYPDKRGDDALEYISLINIRPAQGNRDMELQDKSLCAQIHRLCVRDVPHLFV